MFALARRLPRIFVPPDWLTADTVYLREDILHRIRDVLRLKVGDAFSLLDNSGYAFIATIVKKGKSEWEARVKGKIAIKTELPTKITVVQSLIRQEKCEQVIRMCTEAGVWSICFAPSQRSIIRWAEEKFPRLQKRWQDIAREEAEVAFRAIHPRIHLFSSFREAFAFSPQPRYILYEGENLPFFSSVLKPGCLPAQLSLFVGPEGGFSPQEIAYFQKEKAHLISLGPRILRTEYAAFFALSSISTLLSSQSIPP
ncbi:MAG: RsmE family RNA methyltransferase [bacterium JZ-2024 1]